MSLDEGFEDFYDEFKEWTKKQILHRTYDICLENADKDKEIERLNKSLEEQRHFYLKELEKKDNIIKELENKLLELRLTDVDGKTIVYRMIDKLKELKVEYKEGSDKE